MNSNYANYLSRLNTVIMASCYMTLYPLSFVEKSDGKEYKLTAIGLGSGCIILVLVILLASGFKIRQAYQRYLT